MLIYSATQKGALKMSGVLDPDDVSKFRVYWGAPTFEADTLYYEGMILSPSVDNGYYYVCKTTGKTATEPTIWGAKVTNGTAVFEAVSYDLWLLKTESITASVWTSSITNALSGDVIEGQSTSVWVGPLPTGTTEIELTNKVTKSTGEILNRSFKFKVGEQ